MKIGKMFNLPDQDLKLSGNFGYTYNFPKEI